MFIWIKRFIQRIFTDEISKLRLDLAVSEQLQKSNAKMIDDLQKEVEKLKSSQDTTIGIQNKHDERITENKEVQKDVYEGLVAKFDGFNDKLKALRYSTDENERGVRDLKAATKANRDLFNSQNTITAELQLQVKENKQDILVLDKYDDNAKESISSLYNKIAELKAELHKLRDGKVNENTQAVKELKKELDSFKKNTLLSIARLANITEYLEQEVYSTIPRVNPRRLILHASEISTTETREKTAAKFAIAELAKYMFFPVKKTKFNKAVYDKLKQHTESASRRKSRALVEELISDGWLTETQEVNIKWINVRG